MAWCLPMEPERPKSLRLANTLLALGLMFALALLYVWATYVFFTTRWLGGNDLFVVWRAVRAWLVEGQDPYSEAVTRTVQLEMLGRLAAPGEHQFGFAYPLGIALFIVPLLPVPFPLARAFWMVFLQGLVALFVLASAWPRRLRPLELAALVGATLLFYPTARAIILGQPSVLITAAIAVVLWAVRVERDALAGVALGLTTLKPQMSFLFVPAVLLWAWRAGRQRVWWGFGAASAALVLGPALRFPAWPLSFLEAVRAYSAYTGGIQNAPLLILGEWLGPPADTLLWWGGLFLVGGGLVWLHRRTAPDDQGATERLFLWVLVLTTWIAWRTATTNQIVGLLPLLAWWREGLKGRRFWAAMAVFLVVPWWVFLATLVGDAEQPAAYLPVPLLSLVVLVAYERWGAANRPVADVVGVPGTSNTVENA